MVSSPVVSSIRSRQTGHVGSSTRDGVGGAIGLVDSDAEDGPGEVAAAPNDLDGFVASEAAEKDCLEKSEILDVGVGRVASISTDLTNTT